MKINIKQKKFIYNILIVVFTVVFVFSLGNIIAYYSQNSKSKDISKEVAEEFVNYETEETKEEITEKPEKEQKKGYYHAAVPSSINFTSLINKNKDVKAWIFLENGVINYPVLKGNDNSYYLNHLIDGRKNANGSIFMETLNSPDFSDNNTIIHGHSMKNGTMFGTLLRFKNQHYYNEYPVFYIYTPEKNYKAEIFAAYETDVNDKAFSLMNNKEEYKNFISYALANSSIKTNVKTDENDKIVTLTTCAYTKEDSRFIVCGKLVPLN